MTAILATPFITIAKQMTSHRAAQGVIYADQIKRSGKDVYVNMTLDRYKSDFNEFDELYIYHGNDWGGSVNLFGGMKDFPYIDNFVNFSKFKGTVYSLMIPCPDYHGELLGKMQSLRDKGKAEQINPLWDGVDWDNLKRMQDTSVVVNPNELVLYDKAAMGDSHAICMYRPGWMVNSVPFKTLHGALQMGLKRFLPSDKVEFKELEFYFGNIDIRHHLCRMPDPEKATREIVQTYFYEAKLLADHFGADVKIWEPLPIENPSRRIPKTGWYKNQPFHGSWEDRTRIREIFIDEALKMEVHCVKLYRWTERLKNSKGELDFEFMEKPGSVHLSRAAYPHWQGWEYSGINKKNDLEDFFS